MAGSFTTGADVADSVLAQSGFSATYASEVYPLGTVRTQPADEVASGVTGAIDAGTGNSGVDRDLNFALLAGDREWIFVKAGVALTAGMTAEFHAASGAYVARPCTADESDPKQLAGVADNVIGLNQYGWVIKRGTAVCAVSAGVAVGDNLSTDGATGTDGFVDTNGTDLAATLGNMGVALEAIAGTKAGFAQAYISVG
tara:strand:- start:4843 stop:5439 length:597 start_codon:yes stop_codon:yes gene_type:complete